MKTGQKIDFLKNWKKKNQRCSINEKERGVGVCKDQFGAESVQNRTEPQEPVASIQYSKLKF